MSHPQGQPGAGPSIGFQERPTPAALALHSMHWLTMVSIISRSGRDISFDEVGNHIRATYNFSPTFCSFVPHFAARMLKKSYSKDTFDLKELDLHNGIEHDASLLRLDTAFLPDQSIKHVPFIEELLAAATGKDEDGNDLITAKDLYRMLGK
ncbi:hypothetical protein BDR07DRAFT_1483051 [Suillus spraguei]|nr:hypothetical protein BDR07DRAFT_1483051 [Suillus spraguei]